MKILVLGADGYLGWPTSMHLAARGHQIAALDDYSKRAICARQNIEPLYPVAPMAERARIWNDAGGNPIRAYVGDLCDWTFIEEVFSDFVPDAIVHYAEQPSAPYSMSSRRAAAETLHNNLGATANVIFAVREFAPDAHIVKLGTMGEYGTPNIDIEEGWLEIEHNGRSGRFLFPRQAGSLYHTTKIMDTDLLWFYVRTWGLRVTDLMQGPVYGIFTDQSRGKDELLPLFHYDELFGTVLNRFIVQAVADYPLTVYGAGGQTRGYLNLVDTLACVTLAIEHPADAGELRIFNQFTETFSVNDLAERVQRVGTGLGMNVRIESVPNPRKEMEEHYYNPKVTGLLELGLEPHPLTDDVLAEMMSFAKGHQNRIRRELIFRGTRWA